MNEAIEYICRQCEKKFVFTDSAFCSRECKAKWNEHRPLPVTMGGETLQQKLARKKREIGVTHELPKQTDLS